MKLFRNGQCLIEQIGEFRLHDTVDHAIGALALAPLSLEIFYGLYDDWESVCANDLLAPDRLFELLASAIDAHTGLMFGRRSEEISLLEELLMDLKERAWVSPELSEHYILLRNRIIATAKNIGGDHVVSDEKAAFSSHLREFKSRLAA